MKKQYDFENTILDTEEQFYENISDSFVPVTNQDKMRRQLIEAAAKPPKIMYEDQPVKKPVTLRLPEADIEALKNIAIEQGIPYQSLISSVLHKYVNDDFIEKKEARKVLDALKV